MRKRRRRKEEGLGFYRGAASTLRTRMRKKLPDPVNWYKSREISEEEKKEKKISNQMTEAPRNNKRKRRLGENQREGMEKSRKEEPKSVLFCPYTPGSELAKKLRESEEKMEQLSGFKIKIVEEAGGEDPGDPPLFQPMEGRGLWKRRMLALQD